MPTYEYRCVDCEAHLEVVQSFRDDPLTTHTDCGGDLKKVFSPIGISFKGSGFYKTDSRPSKTKKKKVEASSSESKGDTKTDKASDAKTASKSEPKSGSTDSKKTASGSAKKSA